MISRYSRPAMARIWAPENRYRIWFEIEAHACDAQAALGVIPKSGDAEGDVFLEGNAQLDGAVADADDLMQEVRK